MGDARCHEDNQDQDAKPELSCEYDKDQSSCDQRDDGKHDRNKHEWRGLSLYPDGEHKTKAEATRSSNENERTPPHDAELHDESGVRDELAETGRESNLHPLPPLLPESTDDACGDANVSVTERSEEVFVPPRLDDDDDDDDDDDPSESEGNEARTHRPNPPPSSDGDGACSRSGSGERLEEDGRRREDHPMASKVEFDAEGGRAFGLGRGRMKPEAIAVNRSFRSNSFRGRNSSPLVPPDIMLHSHLHTPTDSSKRSGRGEEDQAVIDALGEIYRRKLKPIEELSMFHKFHHGAETLPDAELQAKPQVLILGQYKSGKTTMIRQLIRRDFPEPSPECFRVVMAGAEERTLGGSALWVSDELPYAGLGKFGAPFLGKFQALVLPSPLLDHVNFVETPSILPARTEEGQGAGQGYPFLEVVEWFADRSDLILLVFDALKLDVSEEFREVVAAVIAHYGDRARVVLTRAHEVEDDRLIKVFGSLMWTLGRCLRGRANPPRVYVVGLGSFGEGDRRAYRAPLSSNSYADLLHQDEVDAHSSLEDHQLDSDEAALRTEIMELPKSAWILKMNRMMQRARLVKTHLQIAFAVRARVPRLLWGAAAAQGRILASLEEVFDEIMKAGEGLHEADLPSVEEYRIRLGRIDLRALPRRSDRLLSVLDNIIERDIRHCITQAGGVRRLYKLDSSTFSRAHPSNNSISSSVSSPAPVRELRRKRKSPEMNQVEGGRSLSSELTRVNGGGDGLDVSVFLKQSGRYLWKLLATAANEKLQHEEVGGIQGGGKTGCGTPFLVMALVVIAVFVAVWKMEA